MPEPTPQDKPTRSPGSAHGDDAAWGPSLGFLAIALGLVVGVLFWWWSAAQPAAPADAVPAIAMAASSPPRGAMSGPRPGTGAAPGAAASQAERHAAAAAAASNLPAPRIRRQRDPDGDQTPDLADYVNEGEMPTMAEVIARLHAAGVYTGLGAFSPPGTKPPLIGLAVPEDFPLPPGYVRHYQATDDGQRIEPILMYSPDRPPLDAQGRPVAVPANRVVPADQAPAGLPVRQIVVPAPIDPTKTTP